MTETQIFRVDKFLRMLVNVDKNFFQGNKNNDSFIETYTWNKAWRLNILIKITTNEIINKKRFSTFRLQNILQKKKLAYSKHKDSEFVSGLIVSFIIFNKYIKDITIVIFPIRIIFI